MGPRWVVLDHAGLGSVAPAQASVRRRGLFGPEAGHATVRGRMGGGSTSS